MENATKALIMAGSVLISILLISFLVFVFYKGGIINTEYDSQKSNDNLNQFNNQFEIYHGRENSYLDLITISNLAWDINKKNSYYEQESVKVIININKGKHEFCKTYEIRCDRELAKNYFFVGSNQVYMYDLVPEYTQQEEVKDSNGNLLDIKYKYLFSCDNIEYNNITGRVNLMEFSCYENS